MGPEMPLRMRVHEGFVLGTVRRRFTRWRDARLSGDDGVTVEPLPQSEFLLYQTEDGRTRIQCRFENETLWLTQAQIAELFQTTPQNVTLHLKVIFNEGELQESLVRIT
jgi:hypothetical protein